MIVRVRHTAAWALCVAVVAAPASVCADTTFRGFFSQRFDVDLGPDSSTGTDSSEQSLRSVTDLGTIFTTRTPRTTLTFAPGVRGTLSTDDGDEDRILPRFNGAVTRLGPRHTLTGNLAFVPDFVTADDFTDVGAVERDIIQFDFSGNAGLNYRLDPLNSVAISGFGRLREYSETTDDITPNASFGGSATWSRSLDPRTTGSLSFRYTYFLPYNTDSSDDAPSRSHTFSLTAGVDRQVRPDFSFSASAGVSFVDRFGDASATEDDQSIGFVGSLSAGYDLTDDTFLSIGLSQSVEPDTRGVPQNRTSLSASITNRINERNTIGVTARAASDTDVFGADSEDEDGNRFEINPFYSYNFTQDWSARLGYALRIEDNEDGDITNRVSLSISRSLDFLP